MSCSAPPRQPTPPPRHSLFVTGASGRVGRLVLPFLPSAQVAVQRRAASPTGPAASGGHAELRWAPLDGPEPFIAWCARNAPPAAMLVLAGTTPATGRDMALNQALAVACLTAAAEAGVNRVLLASSSAVYGHGRPQPWHETDPVQPTTPYGRAKLAMEGAAAPFRARGMAVCCLRIGNVAGADALLLNAGNPDGLVIDRFAGGAGPLRSYIGPQTLARVLLALADAPATLPDILNLGAPRPVEMSALASAAGVDWRWQAAPETAIARLTLECSALAARVPFSDSDSDPVAMVAQWRLAQARAAADPACHL